MSESSPDLMEKRLIELKEAARSSHEGIYLTGADSIELLDDELPEASFGGEGFLLASLSLIHI